MDAPDLSAPPGNFKIVGSTVLIDFPGHVLHGKRALVVSVKPEFNLAPPGAEPFLCHTVFVKAKELPEPIGIGLWHIAGTVEANQRRAYDAAEDGGRQGSLLL